MRDGTSASARAENIRREGSACSSSSSWPNVIPRRGFFLRPDLSSGTTEWLRSIASPFKGGERDAPQTVSDRPAPESLPSASPEEAAESYDPIAIPGRSTRIRWRSYCALSARMLPILRFFSSRPRRPATRSGPNQQLPITIDRRKKPRFRLLPLKQVWVFHRERSLASPWTDRSLGDHLEGVDLACFARSCLVGFFSSASSR